MIIVLADDITGAAEMAGIALRYHLQTRVANDIYDAYDIDVLVVYTNTRSLSKKEAVDIMGNLSKRAWHHKPELFYKKTDSVLRGHVLAEIIAQLKALDLKKALIVPVNPSLGRVIKGGNYFVNGLPVHQTSFSKDPEFPIESSSVEEMLSGENIQVSVIAKDDRWSENGIAVGEASTVEDVKAWAERNDGSIFLAGGGSFFNALLSKRYAREGSFVRIRFESACPILLVSGTTYQKNVERIKKYHPLVSYMPAYVFSAAASERVELGKWAEDVVEKLKKHNKAIIAIDNSRNEKGDADVLRERIAEVTKLVFERMEIGELFIEGGSVAYAIVQKLGWKSFIPTEELEQGIVRMHVEEQPNLHLTIKPGSYEWPVEWSFS